MYFCTIIRNREIIFANRYDGIQPCLVPAEARGGAADGHEDGGVEFGAIYSFLCVKNATCGHGA